MYQYTSTAIHTACMLHGVTAASFVSTIMRHSAPSWTVPIYHSRCVATRVQLSCAGATSRALFWLEFVAEEGRGSSLWLWIRIDNDTKFIFRSRSSWAPGGGAQAPYRRDTVDSQRLHSTLTYAAREWRSAHEWPGAGRQ
jgi:hypothetical protein